MSFEFFARIPGLISSLAGKTDQITEFDYFMTQKVKLQKHYDLWQQRIEDAARKDAIITNGWAFSTLSGISCFESFVRVDKTTKDIYENTPGVISKTIEKILDSKTKKTKGAIVYGYGNLIRETQFIEAAIRMRLLDPWRIYLLDCSIFYHLFASSSLNPLRQIVRANKLEPKIIDFFRLSDEKIKNRLKFYRDDLTSTSPVLHIFLGNAFCNVDIELIKLLFDTTSRHGDIIIAEYANYTQSFFDALENDYTNDLASSALSEIFEIGKKDITTSNLKLDSRSKVLSISANVKGRNLAFRSMLRKKYNPSEVIKGDFAQISSFPFLEERFNIDVYRNTSSD